MKYGADVAPYYVSTQFQPEFELNDAKKAANLIGAELRIINYDILQHSDITMNTADRCYYCKRKLFNAIIRQAAEDGYTTVIDGTNASDIEGDRPGMKALKELEVLSPLRECGITKETIRELSKEADLFKMCIRDRVKTARFSV